jgi:hypothetical protein
MLRRLLEALWGSAPAPHMPAVKELPPGEVDALFATARALALGDEPTGPGGIAGRRVVVVTPDRKLGVLPCPPAGSMPAGQVASIEGLLPRNPRRHVAVIACAAAGSDVRAQNRAIPFLGMLLGLSYCGHAVWIFEGHASSLEAGCREADVLIADSGLVPFLPADWAARARRTMRSPSVYVHDRATFGLRPLPP